MCSSFKTGKTRTREKYRVVYTDHQRLELEKEFHYNRYITIRRKSELAANLRLSERQVEYGLPIQNFLCIYYCWGGDNHIGQEHRNANASELMWLSSLCDLGTHTIQLNGSMALFALFLKYPISTSSACTMAAESYAAAQKRQTEVWHTVLFWENINQILPGLSAVRLGQYY